MKIRYFTERAYNELFDCIGENLTKYQSSDNKWIFDLFNDEELSKESLIEVTLPKLDASDDEFTNVLQIHNAFKGKLNHKQASNPYLWSYLSHCEYWDYTQERWKSEQATENKIKDRFFCSSLKGNSRIGFLRNSIARLWWIGELTYQENKPQPYGLTKLLLSNSDLCVSIIERNYASNRKIILGILMAIKEINDDPTLRDVGRLEGSDKDYEWRSLCKYLNRYCAVTLLDSLDRCDITALSKKYILSLREN